MVVFKLWSISSSKVVDVVAEDAKSPAPEAKPTPVAEVVVEAGSTTGAAGQTAASDTKSPPSNRRSFNLFPNRSTHDLQKPMLSLDEERRKERRAVLDFKHSSVLSSLSSASDKRAQESAEIVRSLIAGSPSAFSPANKTKPFTHAEFNRVKSELSKPHSANKVLAHLRTIDLKSDSSPSTSTKHHLHIKPPSHPIHAVCLNATDEEIGKLHFDRLKIDEDLDSKKTQHRYPSIVNATLESVSSMFREMNVVSLLAEDFGFGQPGDGKGILAGAVPTAETIIKGIKIITPELMSLGYATGKSIIPDHKGVYPPTDRMSVLTYWWGLEILLPPPTLKYIGNAQSISHTVLNFLTALATINNGVREILPFIRYISQFIEFEFKLIKDQDRGQGVVCAATWIMPAALIPRSWDFKPKPATWLQSASDEDNGMFDPQALSEVPTTMPPEGPQIVIHSVDDPEPVPLTGGIQAPAID